MSRVIGVEIVGDSASVERAFTRASVSAKSFDRSLGHSIRGATAGAGVFRSLGRSLAFASGGFLAFAGVSDLIRSSITQADNLEKAQRGLSVAIDHTGGNLAKLKPRYEATAQAAAKFGVNQADATTGLERATLLAGGAVKAQHAYQEALVISKATGKDFNQVLTATAKAQEGVTTSLKRYGIVLPKGATGQEQFNTVMGRFAGQAKANTSAIDRFNATWQNTEIILGTALLPTLDKLLTKFTDWLQKMQRSGRLQHDVNVAVHDGTVAFHIIAGAIEKADHALGGFKHVLELLLALKVASAATRWAGALGVLTGARGAGGLLGAESAAGGLQGRLAALSTMGPISIPIVLSITDAINNEIHGAESGIQGAISGVANSFLIKAVGRGFPGVKAAFDVEHALFGGGKPHTNPVSPARGSGSLDSIFGALAGAFGATLPGRGRGSDPQHPFHTTIPTNLQIQLAQAQLSGNQQAELAALDKQRALLEKELAIAEKARKKKEVLAALTALQAVQSQIDSINSSLEAAKQQKIAAEKAKHAAEVAKRIAREQARKQFNVPLVLQVADAKAQALGLSETSILLKMKRAAERAIKSGRLGLQGQINAWNEIASVNSQLASSTTAALGKFKQASTRALTANLGLTAAQRAALRARLSQLGPGGTVPNQGVGAFGFQIGGNDRPIVIHHTTKLDGKVVERSVTRQQQRRRRRESTQRRGPNAGG